ncbi:MAG TPA: DUF1622 domain-containing protein [Pyrinomonadaceae bacterium]|nr:DUF1622 domain-containing protein [Pyrinomonadaceae bacterium]
MSAFPALYLLQEGARTLILAPREGAAESTIINAVQWLRLMVETTGALIIALGVMAAAYQFLRALIPPQIESFNGVRLTLARFLALALEFQLGADILSTAIAPTWDQIGKLGAIAIIRTALNYFLMREMREERGEGNARQAAVQNDE